GPSVKGYCSGTCKKYGSFWAYAKLVDLKEHLALDCPTQNKGVIDFYTQIIANQQAILSEFLESTKLTPQCEYNINLALIK
ncbi:39471_t:CDS:2, partial [Gigaspora margarita]